VRYERAGQGRSVGVAVEIVWPSHCVQYVFSHPVSVAGNLNSLVGQRGTMSGNVDGGIFKSGLVENVGVEVEIASLSKAVEQLLPIRF